MWHLTYYKYININYLYVASDVLQIYQHKLSLHLSNCKATAGSFKYFSHIKYCAIKLQTRPLNWIWRESCGDLCTLVTVHKSPHLSLQIQLRGLGSPVSSLSRVQGAAPGRKRILMHLRLSNYISWQHLSLSVDLHMTVLIIRISCNIDSHDIEYR